jgi:GDP-L-fucose synthase
MINRDALIYVAGHRGMLGSALLRRLNAHGYTQFITRTSAELDLKNQSAVETFFQENKPDVVFLAAAKVGGIQANNTYRAQFIYENLAIQANVIHSAFSAGVKKLIFFSSSCVYPRNISQPMKEGALWSGPLEPTNEPYAVAKLAGMSMCRAYNQQYGTQYITLVPTNLYGENDNYHPDNAHVVGALINKFHQAKQHDLPYVTLWGTGKPMRELMNVDDAADAAIFTLENGIGEGPFNVGYGTDIEIKDLAELIKGIVGYQGDIQFDSSKPDGMLRKLLDSSALFGRGWLPKITLEHGLVKTYRLYQTQLHNQNSL